MNRRLCDFIRDCAINIKSVPVPVFIYITPPLETPTASSPRVQYSTHPTLVQFYSSSHIDSPVILLIEYLLPVAGSVCISCVSKTFSSATIAGS